MKKQKMTKTIKILALLVALLIPVLIEKYVYPNVIFSVNRYLIFAFIFEFIACNFVFDHKKIWAFIYRRRYLVAIGLFLFLVINGYHGSSVGMYNKLIQPNHSIEEGMPLIGKARFIRTDEYAVDTMGILSQSNYNDLKITSPYLMASNLNVEVFPHLPTNSIGTLTSPRYIGFLFLPTDMAYSFYWYLPIFVCFMALFEFFMIISKQNRLLSLLGTVLITFSPALLWWNSYVFIMYGMTAFLFFRLFLIADNWKKKLIFSILLGWMGSCYIMILYPAWQLTYGYIFLGLFIWQLIVNRKRLKWSDLLYLIPCIGIIIATVVPQLLGSMNQINAMLNTEYPGSRNVIGGENWERNFLYIPSIFYPFIDIDNPCEFSQILSLYPLPIIIGFITIIQNIKNHKKDLLLGIMMILAVFFSIFNYCKVPLLSKISLMTMVPGSRITVVLNIICVIILVLLISNYERKTIKKETIVPYAIIALFVTLVVTYISNRYIFLNSTTDYYLTTNKALAAIGIFFVLNLLFLLNYKKYNKIFIIGLTLFNLIIGLSVFPFTKGFSVVYDKPVSKEINKISSQDKDAIWLSIDTEYQIPNYLIANGSKTINSVNYIPNFDLWKKIDPKGENDFYYNRYAHILISITNEATSYELIISDLLKLNLNSSSVCDLEVDYLLSKSDLLEEDYDILKVKELYNQDGMYIYKTICKGD